MSTQVRNLIGISASPSFKVVDLNHRFINYDYEGLTCDVVMGFTFNPSMQFQFRDGTFTLDKYAANVLICNQKLTL